MAGKAEGKVERALRLTLGVSWDELGAVEAAGQLLWPEHLERRTKSGALEQVEIMLRCVDNAQRFRSRIRAREWARQLSLDQTADKDLVEELENYELMAFAIRDRKAPHDQHFPDGSALFRAYTTASLGRLFERLGQLTDLSDPRYGDLDGEQLWRVVAEVARRGEPSPLAGMPGREQITCIALMARAACTSPSAPSWCRSLVTSSWGFSMPTEPDGSSGSPEQSRKAEGEAAPA